MRPLSFSLLWQKKSLFHCGVRTTQAPIKMIPGTSTIFILPYGKKASSISGFVLRQRKGYLWRGLSYGKPKTLHFAGCIQASPYYETTRQFFFLTFSLLWGLRYGNKTNSSLLWGYVQASSIKMRPFFFLPYDKKKPPLHCCGVRTVRTGFH